MFQGVLEDEGPKKFYKKVQDRDRVANAGYAAVFALRANKGCGTVPVQKHRRVPAPCPAPPVGTGRYRCPGSPLCLFTGILFEQARGGALGAGGGRVGFAGGGLF